MAIIFLKVPEALLAALCEALTQKQILVGPTLVNTAHILSCIVTSSFISPAV